MTLSRRHLLGVAGASAVGLAVGGRAFAAQPSRLPAADEVSLRVFQYATGEHGLDVANDVTAHPSTGPVTNLVIDRPFVYRIEPRWRGGREPLDVIAEVKVFLDITGKVDRSTTPWAMVDTDTEPGESQWTSLVHYGPQAGNRELSQNDQNLNFGTGNLLHPMVTAPIFYTFTVDFQLGSQTGPKRVLEARVRVWRAGDPNIPAGAEVAA